MNLADAASSGCSVRVNGQTHRVEAGTTLAQLLARLDMAPHSVATALNGEFVPRGERAGRVLRDGDHVTCFQPIVGG
ncbi:MAG: sulfur carrier protein ThiS [Caldimonas sp.]|jgi:sulfur carrier protein|uniref:sulfur carrier protein ThiS n=1 Tax=Caldimonas sp. TaxID=2838790 RepID=UPI0039191AA1